MGAKAVIGRLDNGAPALVLVTVECPINFVSAQDVAAVVEHCLLDPTTIRQVIDSPACRTSHSSTWRAQGADKVKHVPLGALRSLQHHAEPFSPPSPDKQAWARPSTSDMTPWPRQTSRGHPGTLESIIASWPGAPRRN